MELERKVSPKNRCLSSAVLPTKYREVKRCQLDAHHKGHHRWEETSEGHDRVPFIIMWDDHKCTKVIQRRSRYVMADNIKGIPFNSEDEGKTFPQLAKTIVYDQACNLGVLKDHPTFSRDEVYVVWFAYVLGYWKALCSTSLPDGRYYEVTFNKAKGVAYVDTYMKTHNVEVDIVEESK